VNLGGKILRVIFFLKFIATRMPRCTFKGIIKSFQRMEDHMIRGKLKTKKR